jgi:hypothetical protein
VRLFMVGEPPPPSFDEIAILQVQRYEDADPRPATRLMMANAAAVGCDAILDYQVSLGPQDLLHGHAMWTAVTGTCVRVRSAPGGPPGP